MLFRSREVSIVKPVQTATSIGPTLSISSIAFPGGSTSLWKNSQQFQLFGGQNYFANLFKIISFANFVKLLETNSDLISYETYWDGRLLNSQKLSISVQTADLIEKSSEVRATAQYVETASETVVGGFTLTEEAARAYDVFRYSEIGRAHV